MYPVFGFGGILPQVPSVGMSKSASHCFALNGDIFKPNCMGI